MLIVDAQIHLWNAGNPTSPWHRQVPAYLKDDALKEMDAGGVDDVPVVTVGDLHGSGSRLTPLGSARAGYHSYL
jgi:predicted TIM-barrel fold metal-dependent hydrolase